MIEYNVQIINQTLFEKRLNELGRYGWELVQYDLLPFDTVHMVQHIRCVLKRSQFDLLVEQGTVDSANSEVLI